MKRKNSILTSIGREWEQFAREVKSLILKLLVLAWIVGMSSFAIFVLMLWLSVD